MKRKREIRIVPRKNKKQSKEPSRGFQRISPTQYEFLYELLDDINKTRSEKENDDRNEYYFKQLSIEDLNTGLYL